MTAPSCPRCNAICDPSDNFCRRCGGNLSVGLPVVRKAAAPAVTARPVPTAVLGSVALLAAGTGFEWLARRMAGNAGRAVVRSLTGGNRRAVAKPEAPKSVTVEEVVVVRKVELRR